MTTRQTIPSPEPGQEQLPNGYSGSDQPADFFIPSCGIEDVDRSVFNLFDKELAFSIRKIVNGQNKPVNIKKPTVIFATGERFAIVKKLRPVRDRNGALMLPAISIRRTSIEQTAEDMNQRGMNQTTGEMVIKRRLDSSDRSFQNYINKLGLKNAALPVTSRDTGANKNDLSIQAGSLLDPKLGQNIWEIITIPQPQFYTAVYEVVYWTSFTEHMNYLIETTLNSQLPQQKAFKLVTPGGYWFVAYLEDVTTSQENFDDFTEQERIIRYSFNLRVKAFLLANNGPGTSVPFKRYVSAVQLNFETVVGNPFKEEHVDKLKESKDKFQLADLDSDKTSVTQQPVSERTVYERNWFNPTTGKSGVGYVKEILRGQRRGETTYRATDKETLQEFMLSISKPK
jgi:hypothetical protein